ncbi:type II secretion system minor pseudopilin GspI [Parvibium lacunae]|uniref:Type II secretion system protein I n=1 Tax=Parvibium lacunae TaxID=1888893 RepID=A0A368KZT3_9BURK|nr:type II secretion system minor pseudopilin GspI [Parvibium lacunae]RCS56815.1 type II secretion system protein GspI [Parvibium lacunae]
MTSRLRTSGFTLIEVLVALLLVGTVLTVAMQSSGALINNMSDLRLRQYALWSAQNRLVEWQIQRLWPPLGVRQQACPQAGVALLCEEEVSATPNPYFRRLEIRVYAVDGPQGETSATRLATLIAYLDR